MLKKFGKPINITEFKSSTLNTDTIKSLIEEYKRLSQFVYKNPKRRKIVKCPVCDSEKKHLAKVIYNIGYNVCDSCGMFYADTQLTQDELNRYYTKDSVGLEQTYTDKSTYQYRSEKISFSKIEFISDFIRPRQKRWLDVGSGMGDVVYNLKKRGFHVRGLELNKKSVKFAKEIFGLELEPKTISEVLDEKGTGSFDVVSYFGVLEHIPDPLKEISYASQLLSPGGLLILEVPNSQSFSSIIDMHFPNSVIRHMVPPEHIMLFSKKALLILAQKFNLEPEAMWFFGLDFYNLILHLSAFIPGFLDSNVCQKLLDSNNEIQNIFDAKETGDHILFIARKKL